MKHSLKELLEGYPLPEQEEKPPYQIYCDMDGVLTDFEERFLSKLKEEGPKYYSKKIIDQVKKPKDFENLISVEEFWLFIDTHLGVSFWRGMEWMPGGKDLWSFISKYNPSILTSPSRHNTSRLGKNLWVRDNVSPKPRVIFAYSKDKQRYSNQNSILIDDKKSNIDEWISRGGIGLRCLHGNISPVIQSLKELGFK